MRTRRWYIITAVAIKLAMLLAVSFFRAPSEFGTGQLYVVSGDAVQYIGMVENVLEHGEYRTDGGQFAARMPGYVPVYLALRAMLPLAGALNAMLVVQAILSGLSCYVLALLALRFTASKRLFHLVFWGYLLSTYVSIWDSCLFTESLCASLLIFSLWFLHRAQVDGRGRDFLVAGMLFTWCIFLRPFLLPVLPMLVLVSLLHPKAAPWGRRMQVSLMFLAPFLVADGAWLLRNRVTLNQWIPLQAHVTYNINGPFDLRNPLRYSVSDLTRSLGIDHAWWNEREASYWFLNKDAQLNDRDLLGKLLTKGRSFHDLEELRERCLLVLQLGDTTLAAQATKFEVVKTLKVLHDDYKTEHPLFYYIGAPVVHLKRFTMNNGVYNIPFPPFEQQNIAEKAIKSFYALLFLFVMNFGGAICCFLLFKTRGEIALSTVIMVIPLYLLFLFPFVLRMHEYRFNVLAYPFLLVCACIGVNRAVSWFQRKVRA